MINILIVEDDKTLSDNIKKICQEIDQVKLHQVYDGDEGHFEASSGIYDLIILDLMLPGLNGYEVLAKTRQAGIETPVLILTAKDGLEDKVEGFQNGADDYLTKPFYREELLLRIQALLRRSLGLFNDNSLKYGPLSLNLNQHTVSFADNDINIQGKEFELLAYLIQNKGIILTKEQIFDRIWGFNSETGITVVEVYMSNLRKHLKVAGLDKAIKTLRNVGYIMAENPDDVIEVTANG
ncbi:DNA-binding response regulator [Aerococcus agrisoli]|uniref:DNA-binding response regulator n=1 Tax=Aerococcus agrisoli TaxID=2487350 RepID=A0A3N4GQ94_9LACT|nr:response regulator transcription factor [Aerococcus agrisoli]RPA65012.1 DNA-binding response regulator [Aerococcus agrisoli]